MAAIDKSSGSYHNSLHDSISRKNYQYQVSDHDVYGKDSLQIQIQNTCLLFKEAAQAGISVPILLRFVKCTCLYGPAMALPHLCLRLFG